jgi:hypothetical protein
MKHLLLLPLFVLGACTSVEDKTAYRQAQIDMVRQQQQSREAIATQREQAEAEKWKHAAAIVAANPESADAFAVAMAVSVVTNNNEADAPVVTLQRESNEALEVVKAVAPSLINVLGTVGTVALNADVAKTQSRNNAAVQINDSQQDARIVEAVAGLGVAASSQVGTSVGGDYYVTGGNVDQSTQTSTATSSTTSNETTTTSTTTTNTDSNNVTEYVTNEYVTTEGTNVSLEDIQALLANNLEVTVLIDGEAVEVEQCEDGGLTFGGDTCS